MITNHTQTDPLPIKTNSSHKKLGQCKAWHLYFSPCVLILFDTMFWHSVCAGILHISLIFVFFVAEKCLTRGKIGISMIPIYLLATMWTVAPLVGWGKYGIGEAASLHGILRSWENWTSVRGTSGAGNKPYLTQAWQGSKEQAGNDNSEARSTKNYKKEHRAGKNPGAREKIKQKWKIKKGQQKKW